MIFRFLILAISLSNWSCSSKPERASSSTTSRVVSSSEDGKPQLEKSPEDVVTVDTFQSLIEYGCGEVQKLSRVQDVNRIKNELCPIDSDFSRYAFHLDSPYKGIGEPLVEFSFSQALEGDLTEYIVVSSTEFPVSSEEYVEQFLLPSRRTATNTLGTGYEYSMSFLGGQDLNISEPTLLRSEGFQVNTIYQPNIGADTNALQDSQVFIYQLGKGVFATIEVWQTNVESEFIEYQAQNRISLIVNKDGKAFELNGFRVVANNGGAHEVMLSISQEVRSHRVKAEYNGLITQL